MNRRQLWFSDMHFEIPNQRRVDFVNVESKKGTVELSEQLRKYLVKSDYCSVVINYGSYHLIYKNNLSSLKDTLIELVHTCYDFSTNIVVVVVLPWILGKKVLDELECWCRTYPKKFIPVSFPVNALYQTDRRSLTEMGKFALYSIVQEKIS